MWTKSFSHPICYLTDDTGVDKTTRNQKSVSTKKQTRIEKFRQQKAPVGKLEGHLDLRDSDLYILVDVNKLQYQIEVLLFCITVIVFYAVYICDVF